MKKMNMEKIFGGFCLSERKFVESLEEGARLYGGATKIDNEIFSNYNENPIFDIFDENDTMFTTNLVGLIVPGTVDVDSQIDNTEFVEYVINRLENVGKTDILNYDVEGSWVMENGDVVIESNNMILFDSKCDEFDMNLLKELAEFVKISMNQEAVSIVINDGLVIY
mgnify:FL=1